MKKYTLLFCLIIFSFHVSFSQESDSVIIRKLYNEELSNGKSYVNLFQLCKLAGPRLSGSSYASMAVEWTEKAMQELHPDTVYLQEIMVPHWVRGDKNKAQFYSSAHGSGPMEVNVCALGGSIATPAKGVRARVIEVKALDDLKKLGRKNIEGKIVFFNRAMDPTQVEVFTAYGGAVDQRWAGPSEAAKYGAIGTVCRSMTTSLDDFPHTGSMRYMDSIPKIPCCAISTNDANTLSRNLKEDNALEFYFLQDCKTLPDEKSFNVVAEIRGTEAPSEIIVAGGHLDAWDLGEGAHDDGAGVVQSMEVIRLFRTLGIRPKHTIRIVAFMNEENGLRGGKKYAELAKAKNEKHIVAIETDAGAFTPRGFSMTGDSLQRAKLKSWRPLLEPYGLHDFDGEGGGADIGPLKEQGVAQLELRPDSQRYFDYHHTSKDVFENVNRRELELCSASMAAIIFLIDHYGL